MIIKSYEVSKIDLKKNLFYLFYGENEGYKKQIIEEKFKKIYIKNVHTYEENEILQNQESFFNTILTKSSPSVASRTAAVATPTNSDRFIFFVIATNRFIASIASLLP